MKIAIIVIGDELLIGQVTDTNSGFIARTIGAEGWSVESVSVVGDDADAITSAIQNAFDKVDVILTTGGLGPTKDDITKSVLCNFFGGNLVFNEEVLRNIKEVFAKRRLNLNKLTEQQAFVPSSCNVIQNRVGTAPIMLFEKEKKVLVAMPGVPFEMREMFTSAVFPLLLERYRPNSFSAHRTMVVTDITESALAMEIGSWEESLPSWVHLAYLPNPGIIRLRLDGMNSDRDLLEHSLDELMSQLVKMLGAHVLCVGDKTPEQVLIEKLREKGLKFATAESCTGGNIAHALTMVPGCSDVFNGSVVSYANRVKTDVLGVSENTISEYGAVSEQTVREMVVGVARVCHADCAVATSGIAGPGGAVEGKPVGTVCVAWLTPREIISKTFYFEGNRQRVIERATTMALIRMAQIL